VRAFVIAGGDVELDKQSVEAAVDGLRAEPIRSHYVEVGGRRFPPEQVLEHVTGLDRSSFDAHHARWVLLQLGFIAGPVSSEVVRLGPYGGRQAAMLEPYRGQWVALAGPLDLLVAAPTPQEVVAWLRENDRRADYGMFRVPALGEVAHGAAPL
jgi:hypothetical protein